MIPKTPGVYIEEKSIFPPSIAQVETAIPAFIGYTEKAEEKMPNDLKLKPKKLSSMLEFERYFGGPPPLSIDRIELDSNNTFQSATITPKFYLYHSMQLFFANGGGDCYIVSVGPYSSSGVSKTELSKGLEKLEKEDEPTLIVFPDAVLLPEEEFYELQREALQQCGELKDRFAILDLKEDNGIKDFNAYVDRFRDGIGTRYLKYGAAYAPFLKTSIKKEIRYRDIKGKLVRSGVNIDVKSLDPSAPSEVKTLIDRLDTYSQDAIIIENARKKLLDTTLAGPPFGVPEHSRQNPYQTLEYLKEQLLTTNDSAHYRTIIKFLYEIVVLTDMIIYGNGTYHGVDLSDLSTEFKNSAKSSLFSGLDTVVKKLMEFEKGAKEGTNKITDYGGYQSNTYKTKVSNTADYSHEWNMTRVSANSTPFTGTTNNEKRLNSLSYLTELFEEILTLFNSLVDVNDTLMRQKEDSLVEQFPVYKNLVDAVAGELFVLPPSGAIAGVYAQVDRDRGVWKAPANVSLNGVSGLTYYFKQSETDKLNVDVNFGKSINAIRFMTGMGFMVWGARTLAGNDNEWRYINVRRFFNMVEESCKKSTMWAVFEPNDASTWIKVKTMIENFLLIQWRNGALQGAKPEEAFFVKVGLGETMTTQDILEGRMNVEIGMAVVRPAEFIILKFSHKLVGA